MASKFFTWTKGDRRNASSDPSKPSLGPSPPPSSSEFPEVCHEGSRSLQKRSLPTTHALNPPHLLVRNPNSIDHAAVLHDAASSASNLLAAVNDILRSPVLATIQRKSLLDKPLPGRPRSLTAPPTPNIPELPGSILLPNKGFSAHRGLSQFDLADTMRRARGDLGIVISSNHSPSELAREMPARRPTHKKSLSENVAKGNRLPRQSMNPSAWSKESNLTSCSLSTNPMSSSVDSMKARIDSDSSHSLQPSPLIIEKRPFRPMSHQNLNSSTSDSENEKPLPDQIRELQATVTAQNHTITTLTAQFASLRSSHEAHVASLTDAHAKEIATLKTYTEGLEQRAASFKTLRHAASSHLMLMLDTEPPPTTPDPRAKMSMPSVTSLQSFQTAIENQGKGGRLSVSTQSTPKKHPRHNPDDAESRGEGASQKPVDDVPERPSSRKKERALHNEVQALEARLDEANAKTIDALEVAQILEQEIKTLHQRENDLMDEIEQLRQQPTQADMDKMAAKLKAAEDKAAILELQVRINKEGNEASVIAAFVRQIEDLQTNVKQKEAYVRQLEHQNELCRLDVDDAEHRLAEVVKINDRFLKEAEGPTIDQLKKENEELKASQIQQEEKIALLQKESHDYYRLLKSEIRKKACKRQECMTDGHLDLELYPHITKSDSAEDIKNLIDRRRAEVHERMSSEGNDAAIEALSDPQRYIEKLQSEIDYHVRDVIAFRLDVKLYEKDNRRLERRIKKRDTMISLLQDSTYANSPIANSVRSANTAGSRGSTNSGTTFSSGLGISTAGNSPLSAHTIMTTPLSTVIPRKDATPEIVPDHELESQPSSSTLASYKKLPKPPGTPSTPPVGIGLSRLDTITSTPTKRRHKPSQSDPPSLLTFSSRTNASAIGADPFTTPERPPTSLSASRPTRMNTQRSASESIISSYARPHSGGSEPLRRPFSRMGSRTATPDRPQRPTGALFDSPSSSTGTIIQRPGTSLGTRESTNNSPLGAKAAVKANVLAQVESYERLLSNSIIDETLQEQTTEQLSTATPPPKATVVRSEPPSPPPFGPLPPLPERNVTRRPHAYSAPPILPLSAPVPPPPPAKTHFIPPGKADPSPSSGGRRMVASNIAATMRRGRKAAGGVSSPPPVANVRAIRAIREAQAKRMGAAVGAAREGLMKRMREGASPGGSIRAEDVGKDVI